MSVPLTIATAGYDHYRDFRLGQVAAEGIEANRPTLQLFPRSAHEQGIAHKLAQPEDIFPASIMASVKI